MWHPIRRVPSRVNASLPASSSSAILGVSLARRGRAVTWAVAIAALLLLVAQPARGDVTSDDGYIRQQGNRWVLGTASVERIVALEDGRLLLKSFKNRRSGHEMVVPGTGVEELTPAVVGVNVPGPWTLRSARPSRLAQGELQLELTLERPPLRVTKTYVVHPGSSVIREWLALANVGKEPIRVVEPAFLDLTARLGDPTTLDFHWMTGGENQPGSWVLKTETLDPAKPRRFDSYEPFRGRARPPYPATGSTPGSRSTANRSGPGTAGNSCPTPRVTEPFDVSIDVSAGDTLAFLVNTTRRHRLRHHRVRPQHHL